MESLEKQLNKKMLEESVKHIEGPKEAPEAASVEELMAGGMTKEEAEEEREKRQKETAQRMRQAIKRDTGESPQM